MPHEPAAERLDELERTVDLLETIPTRMTALEGQIVHLRGEMHDGFSAIRADLRGEMQGMATDLRGEMQGMATGLRGEMQGIATDLRGEMHTIADDLRAEMHALHRVTLEAIKAGDEETRRQMGVLFEEFFSHIATLGEALKPRKRR